MPGNRLSSRLQDYDYGFGTFFVSIVAAERACLFGEVRYGRVSLSPAGEILREEWLRTPEIRKEVRLDEWIAMPDHFQAIITINKDKARQEEEEEEEEEINKRHVGGACWRPCPGDNGPVPAYQVQKVQPDPHSLPRIVNQFKATATRRIRLLLGSPRIAVWQRGYHDRIIRGEYELDKARRYVRDNPRNWTPKSAW